MSELVERAYVDALRALRDVVRVAAEYGSDAAVGFAADWLSAGDAMDDEDVANFERWRNPGSPNPEEQ